MTPTDEAKLIGAAVIHVCPKCEYPEENCKCLSLQEFIQKRQEAVRVGF